MTEPEVGRKNRLRIKTSALRLLGVIFLVIGLWLLKSLVTGFMVLYTGCWCGRGSLWESRQQKVKS